jgi:phage major head subunit gpT-like protein
MTVAVSPGLLAAINTSYKSAFVRGLARIEPMWPKMAMRVDSTAATEVYPFLGRLTTLREWIGDRVAEDLAIFDFVIKNKHYEKTLRVSRDAIEDDQFGIYNLEAENLGDAAARHPDKLIFSLLENGFTNLCYDGKAFFATDHPTYGGTTFSNTGTTALSATAYGVAISQMQQLKDDGGEVLDVFTDSANLYLVVPPALQETARQILNADFISVSGGSTQNNVWKGSAQLIVAPRLGNPSAGNAAKNWYLIDMSRPVKPFIMQFRKSPQLVSKTNMTDENVFRRNEFLWGVDYRGNAGYGLPHLAFGAAVS